MTSRHHHRRSSSSVPSYWRVYEEYRTWTSELFDKLHWKNERDTANPAIFTYYPEPPAEADEYLEDVDRLLEVFSQKAKARTETLRLVREDIEHVRTLRDDAAEKLAKSIKTRLQEEGTANGYEMEKLQKFKKDRLSEKSAPWSAVRRFIDGITKMHKKNEEALRKLLADLKVRLPRWEEKFAGMRQQLEHGRPDETAEESHARMEALQWLDETANWPDDLTRKIKEEWKGQLKNDVDRVMTEYRTDLLSVKHYQDVVDVQILGRAKKIEEEMTQSANEVKTLTEELENAQSGEVDESRFLVPSMSDPPRVNIFMGQPRIIKLSGTYQEIQEQVFEAFHTFVFDFMEAYPAVRGCLEGASSPSRGQLFAQAFMHPLNSWVNLLLVHSLGSGKTCTMGLIVSIFARMGYKIIIASKNSSILQDVLKSMVGNQCDANVQQIANGGYIQDFVIGFKAMQYRGSHPKVTQKEAEKLVKAHMEKTGNPNIEEIVPASKKEDEEEEEASEKSDKSDEEEEEYDDENESSRRNRKSRKTKSKTKHKRKKTTPQTKKHSSIKGGKVTSLEELFGGAKGESSEEQSGGGKAEKSAAGEKSGSGGWDIRATKESKTAEDAKAKSKKKANLADAVRRCVLRELFPMMGFSIYKNKAVPYKLLHTGLTQAGVRDVFLEFAEGGKSLAAQTSVRNKDPLAMTLIAIDEIHLLTAPKAIDDGEKPVFSKFRDLIWNSYEISKGNSVRLVGASATPDAGGWIYLLNLVTLFVTRKRAKLFADYYQAVDNFEEEAEKTKKRFIKEHWDPENRRLKEESVAALEELFKGVASYFNVSADASSFPVPYTINRSLKKVSEVRNIDIRVTMLQENGVAKCLQHYKGDTVKTTKKNAQRLSTAMEGLFSYDRSADTLKEHSSRRAGEKESRVKVTIASTPGKDDDVTKGTRDSLANCISGQTTFPALWSGKEKEGTFSALRTGSETKQTRQKKGAAGGADAVGSKKMHTLIGLLSMKPAEMTKFVNSSSFGRDYSPVLARLLQEVDAAETRGKAELKAYYEAHEDIKPENRLHQYKQVIIVANEVTAVNLNSAHVQGADLIGALLTGKGFEIVSRVPPPGGNAPPPDYKPLVEGKVPYRSIVVMGAKKKYQDDIPEDPTCVPTKGKKCEKVHPSKYWEEAFNDGETNKDGRKIAIAVLSGIFKEGISLFDARTIHVVGMFKSRQDFLQAAARIIRNCRRTNTPFFPERGGWPAEIIVYSPVLGSSEKFVIRPEELIAMFDADSQIDDIISEEMYTILKRCAPDRLLFQKMNDASEALEGFIKPYADYKPPSAKEGSGGEYDDDDYSRRSGSDEARSSSFY